MSNEKKDPLLSHHKFSVPVDCRACACAPYRDCRHCKNTGVIMREVFVPWDLVKDIILSV